MRLMRSHLPVIVLLFASAGVHAADARRALPSSSASSSSSASTTLLQQGIEHIIALPAELANLLLLGVPSLAAPVSEAQWQSAVLAHGSLATLRWPGFTERERLSVMLEESSFRVPLRDEVNLRCDVTQAPVFAEADEFVVKLGLQIRFR
jgi:hypothetical protein